MDSQKIRHEEGSEPNYENLSRVFRSNLFPSVQRCWKSRAKETFIDHGSHISDVNKQNFRQKDWLGKWHERDIYRLNVLRLSDDKYQERMKRVRHSVDLPSINKQAKTNARTTARKSPQKEKTETNSGSSKPMRRKGTNQPMLPAIQNNNKNTVDEVPDDNSEQLKLPNIDITDSSVSVAGVDNAVAEGNQMTEKSQPEVDIAEDNKVESPKTNFSFYASENIGNENDDDNAADGKVEEIEEE